MTAGSLGVVKPRVRVCAIRAKINFLMVHIKNLYERDNWLINNRGKGLSPAELTAKRNQFKKQETEADAASKKLRRI